MAVSPTASAYIARSTKRRSGSAVRTVYRCMALVTTGFYAAFMFGEYVAWQRSALRADHSGELGPRRGLSSEEAELATGRGAEAVAVLMTRCAFYIWVTLQNILASSTMWSRIADVFSPDAGARLFGLIGSGATLGQLFGSVCAGLWASSTGASKSSHPSRVAINQLVLISALLVEMAGVWASRLSPPPTAKESPVTFQGQDGPWEVKQPRLGALAKGMQLIWRSQYLRHICIYLLVNSFVSSMFYFTKTTVVAHSTMRSSSSRTAWFASVNSASASLIFILQVSATGRVLHGIGIAAALAFTPLVAAVLMATVAVFPVPVSVGAADVLRRLATYVVSRPAREVLFTVVSREEKYQAKVIIDTVMLRVGDSLAAGILSLLGYGVVSLSPSTVAWIAGGAAFFHVAVAYTLGLVQQRLAQGVSIL
eukprot:CAMPEP_0177603260 /NCGR_PEP_ID=MMETSP0419_2-20121207/15403_1 /TAXON_ID=582737 /ORGANISM="Tetraselmis sp., Strain GSL018" /LENGTH=423 /DNA_ID=CAMNT_0019096991 /DNA_START=306 /DNA_END=1577 /DNA_ORIENTATION=-